MYDYEYTVNEELICLRDDKNIHSDNAIEVLSKVEEKKKKSCVVKPVEKLVGHVPEALAKILYPMMIEWRIIWMKAVITGGKRRGTWVPGGGIELPCTYYIYAAKTHKNYIGNKIKEAEKNLK